MASKEIPRTRVLPLIHLNPTKALRLLSFSRNLEIPLLHGAVGVLLTAGRLVLDGHTKAFG